MFACEKGLETGELDFSWAALQCAIPLPIPRERSVGIRGLKVQSFVQLPSCTVRIILSLIVRPLCCRS